MLAVSLRFCSSGFFCGNLPEKTPISAFGFLIGWQSARWQRLATVTMQSMPSALGLIVFGVRSQAEQGFDLTGSAHDLVNVEALDRGVLLNEIRKVSLGL
jgi:hypothetical protein